MPHDVQYSGPQNQQRIPHEPWCAVPHPFALAQCTCPASIDMGFGKNLNDLSYDQYDRLYDPMPMSDRKKEFIRQKLHGMDPRNSKYWPISPDTGIPFDPLVGPPGPPTLPGSLHSGTSITVPIAVPLQATDPDDDSDETFEDEMEEDTPGTEAYIKKNQPAFWVVFQQREDERQRRARGEAPTSASPVLNTDDPLDPDEGMSEAAVARKRRRQDTARHAQEIQANLRANGLVTQPTVSVQLDPAPTGHGSPVSAPGSHHHTGVGPGYPSDTVSGPAIPIPHTQVPCMEPLMYNPDPDNPDLKVMIECEVEENHTNAPHMKRLQGRKRGQDVFIGWWES